MLMQPIYGFYGDFGGWFLGLLYHNPDLFPPRVATIFLLCDPAFSPRILQHSVHGAVDVYQVES